MTIKIITAIALSFFARGAVVPWEASALTLKSEEIVSTISENRKAPSQNIDEPGQISFALTQEQDNPIFQSSKEANKASYYPQNSVPGTGDSDYNLIHGDFSQTGFDHSDQHPHVTNDNDDLRHKPFPSPIPIPSSALLIGTGLALLTGLVLHKGLIP